MGERARLYPRRSNSNRFFGADHKPDSAASEVLIDNYRSLRLAFLQLFVDHLERLRNFALQIREVCGQCRSLRIDHHIDCNRDRKITQPHGLTQATLDSISLDRAAQRLAYCETNSRALQLVIGALQIKHCHVRREMPASLLVNPLKVRMPQQAMALWKLALRFSSGRLVYLHSCSGRERPSPKKTALNRRPRENCYRRRAYLFTKSGFYGNALAPFGTAPGNDRASALGLHTGPEAVHLRSAAAVRLECTFRHEKSLVLLS
jgi:hypothetical protein